MNYYQEITEYRQYELKRGNMHTVCWLPNPNIHLGMRVKIGDDPFWWDVIGKSDMIKEELEFEQQGILDGAKYDSVAVSFT